MNNNDGHIDQYCQEKQQRDRAEEDDIDNVVPELTVVSHLTVTVLTEVVRSQSN